MYKPTSYGGIPHGFTAFYPGGAAQRWPATLRPCRSAGRPGCSWDPPGEGSHGQKRAKKVDVPVDVPIPICSMYGIFTYIWVIFRANVGKYSIHGAYGIGKCGLFLKYGDVTEENAGFHSRKWWFSAGEWWFYRRKKLDWTGSNAGFIWGKRWFHYDEMPMLFFEHVRISENLGRMTKTEQKYKYWMF